MNIVPFSGISKVPTNSVTRRIGDFRYVNVSIYNDNFQPLETQVFSPFFILKISESEKVVEESKMEIDEGVDERETGTQNETITYKKTFADKLTVIMFYDPC